MLTSPSVLVRPPRAWRAIAVVGLLLAVALSLTTVAAPPAEAATVLGQFRNANARCLENLNNATTANNKIQLNACGPSTAAAQRFSRWADGSIRTAAGRCLGTYNGGTANNTAVVLLTCNPATTSQRWTVRSNGTILNQKANRCLTPYNGSTANGTWMVVATCSTAAPQRWTVPAVSTPTTTTPPPSTTTPRPTTTTVPPTSTTVPPATTVPPTTTTPPPAGARDPLRQPFASNSIWNMPIGSGAVFAPANLPALPGNSTGARVPQVDDEPLVLTPTAPQTQVLYNTGIWNGDRCQNDPNRPFAVLPIPANWTLPSDNKNQSAAILAADGRTVVNVQPLARCRAGGPATAWVRYPDQDIYGPGIQGAHGGSGMSALGGSLRIGELRPGQTGPRHVLKVNVYGRGEFGMCATRAECFRWPAVKSDTDSATNYGRATQNTNTAMRMGALLAIPPSVNLSSLGLQTEPGRQIAWTLQNYGAYIVDDTNGPSFALNAENGPGGSMRTQFRADYGYDFEVYASNANAWSRDIQKLRQALGVVDNNGPASVGGGGTPRQPLLPELVPPPATPGPSPAAAPMTDGG